MPIMLFHYDRTFFQTTNDFTNFHAFFRLSTSGHKIKALSQNSAFLKRSRSKGKSIVKKPLNALSLVASSVGLKLFVNYVASGSTLLIPHEKAFKRFFTISIF